MSKISHALIISSASFILSSCGDIAVEQVPVETASIAGPNKISAQFCPSTSALSAGAQFKVSQVFVMNLTTTVHDGEFFIDSDIDGLPDSLENSLGYSPTERRSTNQMLDGLCQRLGGPTVCQKSPTCSGTALGPGLSDCDLAHFRTPASGFITGLDSDQDSIPDLIEAVRGLNVVENDAYDDNDQDGFKNISEILYGTDVSTAVSKSAENQIKFTQQVSTESCLNGQKFVNLNIQKISYVDTLPLLDPVFFTVNGKTIDFSHKELENVVAIFYVSEAYINTNLKRELYMHLLKIDPYAVQPDIALTDADFIFLGEIK